MIVRVITDFFEDHTFDSLPMAVIDKNSNILESNKQFKQCITVDNNLKFKDLFQNIKVLDNRFYGERDGYNWLIIYKKYLNKYKVWCLLQAQDAPSVWSTIPMPMILMNNDYEIKYINKSAADYFPKMQLNDLLTKYYPGLTSLKHNTVCDLIFDSKLSKIQIYRHNECLWLIIIKTSTDISEMDQQLKEANHLKAIGQITSSVVHDFRNILAAVSGYCDLIAESSDLKSIQEYTKQIANTTLNATTMVKELLRFARSSNTVNQLCCPAEIISNLTSIIDKITGTAIKVKYNIEEKMARVAISNSDIERIILNIVINAKDSIKSFGNIGISIYKRYFTAAWEINNCYMRKGFYVVLRISDNGCGILYENQTKIFTPFFTTKKNGNGLGLSTIISILRDSGAGINILSTPENGTCVLIYMPIVQGFSNEKVVTEEGKKEIRNGICAKIVLVEDNDDVLNVCKIALQKDGYQVFTYKNGEDALKFLKHNQCDLLITDANLPGISGAELVESVVDYTDRIVVISGYDKSMLSESFPRQTQFLIKPISLLKFREIVYKVLTDDIRTEKR